MPFSYTRPIWFQDTDAAGVVYFASVLAICHEAYEASLVAVGIDLPSFFNHPHQAVPIVHASADFLRPLRCGDRPIIHLHPHSLEATTFTLHYEIRLNDQLTAKAITKHCCIDPQQRQRIPVPRELVQWFEEWSEG